MCQWSRGPQTWVLELCNIKGQSEGTSTEDRKRQLWSLVSLKPSEENVPRREIPVVWNAAVGSC